MMAMFGIERAPIAPFRDLLLVARTHDRLTVLRALGNALGGRPCRAHTSDLRVYVEATGMATFPDASVICGENRASKRDRAWPLLQPALWPPQKLT